MSLERVILGILGSLCLVRGDGYLTKNECLNGSKPNDCKCPPNFTWMDSGDICVMLTEPRAWSEELCRGFGTDLDYYDLRKEDWESVKELIRPKNTSEIWISVKSDGQYGKIRSVLPGSKWGSQAIDLDDPWLDYSDREGNCLKVNVEGNSAIKKFVDCKGPHSQLCIYRPGTARMYCEDPEEVTTTYSLYQDTCFKIERNNSNSTQFGPETSEKNIRLSALVNCSTNCIAHPKILSKFVSPKLNLNYDHVLQKLLLSITDSRFLWRRDPQDYGFTCFSGADLQQRKKVSIQQKLWPLATAPTNNDTVIYELKIVHIFPDRYWCEGFSVPNITLVASQKIVAQKKDSDVHMFAVRMQVPEDSPDNIRGNIQEHLQKQNWSKYTDLNVRINLVRIESTQTNKKLNVVIHVTAKTNASKHNKVSGIPLELLDGISDHYQMKNLMETILIETSNANYNFLGIKSTEMCFPEQADRNGTWWPKASIGESVTLHRELCMLKTGLPLYRKCLGDRINGGSWESDVVDLDQCLSKVKEQTDTLYSYFTNSSGIEIDKIEGALEGINRVIKNYTEEMIATDIHLVAGTIERFRRALLDNGTNNATVIANKGTTYCCGLADILNSMMDVKESALNESQSGLNATSRLLDATEDIINQLSKTESLLNGADRSNCPNDPDGISSERGTMLLRKPKFALLVADPAKENITGMALVRTPVTKMEDFHSYEMRLLTMDELEEDILAIENLEIASFVPRSLVDKMKLLRNETRISGSSAVQFRVVISVYFNDRVFLESLGENSRRTNGKIISVTVPGYVSKLPEMLPIFVREKEPAKSSLCEFWDFVPPDSNNSRWSSNGCEFAQEQNNVTLCKCSHMTSFSRIFQKAKNARKQEQEHPKSTIALDVITTVGCVLSLLGVAGIFLTAILFPRWNNVFNTKILLHLSLAVAIQFIVFIWVDHFKKLSDQWCLIQGASLHYLILVAFMWMLVIAYLQFMQFVKVLGKLRPTHCVLKASIFSWGVPLAPVGYFVTTRKELYYPYTTINPSDICYPHGEAQIYGLIIPIALILTINVACFFQIIYSVSGAPDNLTRSANKSMAMLQLRLFVLLFFQFGLSWIFGMMVSDSNELIWSYLFCLTAPYQGFMLFVNFILLQPSTRRLWTKKITDVISESQDKFTLKKSTSAASQAPNGL